VLYLVITIAADNAVARGIVVLNSMGNDGGLQYPYNKMKVPADGDSVLSEFFENYLEQTLKNYLAYKSAMDAQFQQWLEMGQGLSGLTQKAMSNLAPFQSWMQFFPGKAGKKESDAGEEER